MGLQHIDLVFYAKTHGLLYLMAFSIAIVVYAYWPSNKSKFDDAAKRILDDEDSPCQ